MYKQFEKDWTNLWLKEILKYRIQYGVYPCCQNENTSKMSFKTFSNCIKSFPSNEVGTEHERLEFIRDKYREYFKNTIWPEYFGELCLKHIIKSDPKKTEKIIKQIYSINLDDYCIV